MDTNVVVRLLVDDDHDQARKAAEAMQGENVLIPKTVVLETEWVLRHAYGIEEPTIMEAFEKLLGLPNVSVETPRAILQAIEWCRGGLDFADALHLASGEGIERFLTFDRKLIKKARRLTEVEVREPAPSEDL